MLVFLTNHLELAAATVSAIYKERWQIELFFRALKQSLRVKTFVGTSANALKTQLWTALIVMMVVKYLQLRSTFGWSLSNLVALLRQQLFVYRDLWAWIDDPFQPPNVTRKIVRAVYAATELSWSMDWTAAMSHMPTVHRNFEISRGGI
jgi:hypothetical protein